MLKGPRENTVYSGTYGYLVSSQSCLVDEVSMTPAQCTDCFTTSGFSFLQQDFSASISALHSLSW